MTDINENENANEIETNIVEPVKKRGRKPKIKNPEDDIPHVQKKRKKTKGGKIISNQEINDNNKFVKTNIILHLKCNLKI